MRGQNRLEALLQRPQHRATEALTEVVALTDVVAGVECHDSGVPEPAMQTRFRLLVSIQGRPAKS